MKTVKIIKYKSTELSAVFNRIATIEIDDLPFDSGNYGEMYFCKSVNGKQLPVPQAIKILLDDGNGCDRRGYKTIYRLQEQIIKRNIELKQKKEKPIEQVNALWALPQFSYEGIMNGKKIFGYSENFLNSNEWFQFGKIFYDDDPSKRKQYRTTFYNLPLSQRIKIAFDLAEGFKELEAMGFIHADLNPKNFFVNIKDSKLCLIDYDSGAINDNPETWGKPGEWLAPEIQEQLIHNSNGMIKVDLNTDTWAVAIGVHFLLFPFHPLFYLKIRGKKEMAEYFLRNKWPLVDRKHPNFRVEYEKIYQWYCTKLNSEIQNSLVTAFADTINNGYANPGKRPSYKQWLKILNGTMLPPVIKNFECDNLVVAEGTGVTLKWEVENANNIFIDSGRNTTDVTGKNRMQFIPKNNLRLKLKALGSFGIAEKMISILVIPNPQIISFTSSKDKILNGDNIRLSWKAKYFQKIFLSDGRNKQEIKSDFLFVTPKQDTKYFLEVQGKLPSQITRQNILVKVLSEVKIITFSAAKDMIFEEEEILFSWKVENASQIKISSVGDVSSINKKVVKPLKSETYILTASNNLSNKSSEINIRVFPKITFNKTTPNVNIGFPLSYCDISTNKLLADFALDNMLQNSISI